MPLLLLIVFSLLTSSASTSAGNNTIRLQLAGGAIVHLERSLATKYSMVLRIAAEESGNTDKAIPIPLIDSNRFRLVSTAGHM